MRVTIGERLGLPPKETGASKQTVTPTTPSEPVADPRPNFPVLDLRTAPSASDLPCRTPGRYCEECECPYCSRKTRELAREREELGPPRVRGEMVWTKKDVAILVIEGRGPIAPEVYAENRRR